MAVYNKRCTDALIGLDALWLIVAFEQRGPARLRIVFGCNCESGTVAAVGMVEHARGGANRSRTINPALFNQRGGKRNEFWGSGVCVMLLERLHDVPPENSPRVL